MRKLIWVLLALTLLSATMFAQKAGIEFGYSYIRVNPGAPADAISMNGFEAQPIFMLKHHFAIAADFTGSFNSNYHGVDVKDFFYAAGPAYVIPLGKAAMANVHFIVGGNHLGLSEGGMSETYNAFAMAPGGAPTSRSPRRFTSARPRLITCTPSTIWRRGIRSRTTSATVRACSSCSKTSVSLH